MGLPKGYPKQKGSGRKKGSLGKKTMNAQAIAQRLNVDPFEILLYIADGNWQGIKLDSKTLTKATSRGELYEVDQITIDNRVRAAAAAAEYLYPKRKQIDGTISLAEAEQDLSDLTDEELESFDV
jgi:hypothetical protein